VSAVRTDPLTPEEIASYHEHGFLFPIRVLDDAQVEEARAALDDHLEGRRESKAYELTDPIVDSGQATVGSGSATTAVEAEVEKKPHSVPFLFNLWERDERFWKIDSNPVIAGMARQLLDADEVVLMEDGAVIKKPVVGGKLSWHQDYAYWPLATPSAVTCWIALDDVGGENGGMQVAAGSHLLGEKLPVEFGDGSSFMHAERPGVGEVRQPEEEGLEVVGYEL
jgi:ectoine hydroxylase-related dioxygenase (phytanoyl-CoA dioxygenase family)